MKLRRGCVVIDKWGDKGVVVRIEPGLSKEDHGTIVVWQMDRFEYGANNCESYAEFEWEQHNVLTVLEEP